MWFQVILCMHRFRFFLELGFGCCRSLLLPMVLTVEQELQEIKNSGICRTWLHWKEVHFSITSAVTCIFVVSPFSNVRMLLVVSFSHLRCVVCQVCKRNRRPLKLKKFSHSVCEVIWGTPWIIECMAMRRMAQSMGRTLARNKHLTIYSRTGYLVFDDWRFFDSDGSNTPNQQLFVWKFPNIWN